MYGINPKTYGLWNGGKGGKPLTAEDLERASERAGFKRRPKPDADESDLTRPETGCHSTQNKAP